MNSLKEIFTPARLKSLEHATNVQIANNREHDKDCRFYKAMVCTVAIECKHGYDVCLKCDPCTCNMSTLEKERINEELR